MFLNNFIECRNTKICAYRICLGKLMLHGFNFNKNESIFKTGSRFFSETFLHLNLIRRNLKPLLMKFYKNMLFSKILVLTEYKIYYFDYKYIDV